jgi:hypothetical protein
MCKSSCCPPKGSPGTGVIIAVIAGIIIAASALRVILGLLITLIEITLITTAALTILGLITWALIRRHRRQATTGTQTAVFTRSPAAVAPRYVLMIGSQPIARLPRTSPSGRALASGHEHAVRHFADVIASYDDPAAVDDLIRRALHERHHT